MILWLWTENPVGTPQEEESCNMKEVGFEYHLPFEYYPTSCSGRMNWEHLPTNSRKVIFSLEKTLNAFCIITNSSFVPRVLTQASYLCFCELNNYPRKLHFSLLFPFLSKAPINLINSLPYQHIAEIFPDWTLHSSSSSFKNKLYFSGQLDSCRVNCWHERCCFILNCTNCLWKKNFGVYFFHKKSFNSSLIA